MNENERQVYVFLGANDFLREDEQDRVLSRYLSRDAGLELIDIDGSDAPFFEIETALLSAGMFSNSRVVRIRRVDKMQLEDQNKLAGALSGIARDTVVLLSAVKLDGRGKLMRTLRSCAVVKEFKNLYQRDAVSWCRDRARHYGLRMGPREADFLVQLAGTDQSRIDKELEKISIYLNSPGSVVSVETIARVAGTGGEVAVFDLLDDIGGKDGAGAVRVLRRMLEAGEPPVKAQFIIARYVRDLLQVASMMESGLQRDAIIAALGIHPYRAKKLIAHASRFDIRELTASLKMLLASDLRIKSSELTPGCWLEMAIYRICGAHRRTEPAPTR